MVFARACFMVTVDHASRGVAQGEVYRMVGFQSIDTTHCCHVLLFTIRFNLPGFSSAFPFRSSLQPP